MAEIQAGDHVFQGRVAVHVVEHREVPGGKAPVARARGQFNKLRNVIHLDRPRLSPRTGITASRPRLADAPARYA